MKFGGDTTDVFSIMDDLRLRLSDMGETISQESYEYGLRGLPQKYQSTHSRENRLRL